jgi:hypothetical protein
LKTQSTQNGVLVEIQNPGTLPMADSGMQATILYRGAFVNGKIFDSNMVNSKLVGQPLNVTVGVGSVIRGWDEGLRLFGKGGKGRLLVPALLAYGPQGSAPVIPPYANLVFDIEISDVTVPAPKPAQPMPGQPNQGQPTKK